jgi:DNA-binding Lrp family transcriptional regulator
MDLPATSRRMMDAWQRHLPLVPRPFAAMAASLGVTETEVLGEIGALIARGLVSRVGATVRPNTAGASLLAALEVPPARLDEVAAIVSAEPFVNHNYEREHAFNLWFVVAAPDERSRAATLARLTAATRLDILELPLQRSYHLDLGFPLDAATGETGVRRVLPARDNALSPLILDARDRALLAGMEDGLEIVPRPFRALARRAGLREDEAIARLGRMLDAGVISRLGLVVRHRALGFAANAMTVWDVPDDVVDQVGEQLAAEACVTLCYRRPRRLPRWPFNLFAMIHGRERQRVEAQIADLTGRLGLAGYARATLFSRRCFLQRGARFKAA